MTTNEQILYKIYTRIEWNTEGPLTVTLLDQRSGFVHLSSSAQIERTIELYFRQEDHVIVGFNRSALDDKLIFEQVASRESAMPHFYGLLKREWICSVSTSWSQLEINNAESLINDEHKV